MPSAPGSACELASLTKERRKPLFLRLRVQVFREPRPTTAQHSITPRPYLRKSASIRGSSVIRVPSCPFAIPIRGLNRGYPWRTRKRFATQFTI